MKYGLKFYCEKPLRLPVNYNKILQAAILKWIDDGEYSQFLHDKGHVLNNRKYKLFTFSNIKGNYIFDSKSKSLIFTDEISIVLSFYGEESYEYILNNIYNEKPIRFGDNYCAFVECASAEEIYQDCVVDTVSPITVHSTMLKPDGKKFTYYYEPFESGFADMLAENIVHKYEAVFGPQPNSKLIRIQLHKGIKPKRVITNYGGMTIKAWNGRFALKGSSEMIKIALLSGLGDKNSIGFGCVLQNKLLKN